MASSIFWTDHDDHRLAEMVRAGKTDVQIARALRRSRGAVASRRRRMDMQRNNHPGRRDPADRPAEPGPKRMPVKAAGPGGTHNTIYRQPAMSGMTHRKCQWIGEGEGCDAPAAPGRSYCRHHCTIVFRSHDGRQLSAEYFDAHPDERRAGVGRRAPLRS